MKRPAWVCRVVGHCHRDPFFGHVISFYMPSAEGHLGVSDPRGRLIGTCGCGHEWRARR